MKEKTRVIVLSSPEGLQLGCWERSALLQAQGRIEHTGEKCVAWWQLVTNLAAHYAHKYIMEWFGKYLLTYWNKQALLV